jgi:hypothetical protein
MLRRLLATIPAAAFLTLLPSCHNQDILVHDQFEQASFDSDVDILWVIDNSQSMERIQAAVQENFTSFINEFANVGDDTGEVLSYDNLGDGALAWSEFLLNQERFLNYRMGVVTTDIDAPGSGNKGNIRDAGPIGTAATGPLTCSEPGGRGSSAAVITPDSDNPAGQFNGLVDVGITGAGGERGLHAAALAMCKGQPPTFWDNLDQRSDTDPVRVVCSAVPAEQRYCNTAVDADGDADPFFRDAAATVVIVVSDEGDVSATSEFLPPPVDLDACRTEHADDPLFGECDCRISWWADFFDGIDRAVVFANIGPTYQAVGDATPWCDGTTVDIPGPCNTFNSPTCNIDFYQQLACLTAGRFVPIESRAEGAEQCAEADFQNALRDIGRLISNLSGGWKLSAVPDPETIRVMKNFETEIPNADTADGLLGGWRYVPNNQAVTFTGDAVPGYDDQLDIYYLPAFDRNQNTGRPLPF